MSELAMRLIDRPVDFYRPRHTRCAACGHEGIFELGWFDLWSQGHELCPGCGADCTQKKATRVVVDPKDPALDDEELARLAWWHTSTQRDWPSPDYDPASRLNDLTVQRMGAASVVRWAARQKAKALHVGTYESAIHNMLRRMRDQPENEAQFYLYRVALRPDVVARPGCEREVVDWMGDVSLAEVCPPGIDITRYLNEYEDPGGISLALGRQAIAAVQRLSIPLMPRHRPRWWADAVERLRDAATAAAEPPPEPHSWRERIALRSQVPPLGGAKQDILGEVITDLPVNLHDKVMWAACASSADEPVDWCDYLAGLMDLVNRSVDVVRHAQIQQVVGIAVR